MIDDLDSIHVTFSKSWNIFDSSSIRIDGIKNKHITLPKNYWILFLIKNKYNGKKGFALLSGKTIKKVQNKTIWSNDIKNRYQLECDVIEESSDKQMNESPQWSPSDSDEDTCTICYDIGDDTNILYEKGCDCKGSSMYVHIECLANNAIFSQNKEINVWETCMTCLQPYSDEIIKKLEDYMEDKLRDMLEEDDKDHEEKCNEIIKIAMFFYKKQRYDKTNEILQMAFTELDFTEGHHFLILQQIQDIVIEMIDDMNYELAQTILQYMIELFNGAEVQLTIQQSSNLTEFTYEIKLLLANTIYFIQEESGIFDKDDEIIEMYTDIINNHRAIRLQAADKIISILKRQQSYDFAIKIMINIFNQADDLLDTSVVLDIQKIKDDIDLLKEESISIQTILEQLNKRYDFIHLLYLNQQFDIAQLIIESINDLLLDDEFISELSTDEHFNQYDYKITLLSADIIYMKMISDGSSNFNYALCVYKNILQKFPSDLYVINKVIEILKVHHNYTEVIQILMNMLYNPEHLLHNSESFSVESIKEKITLIEMYDLTEFDTIQDLYTIYHLVEILLLQNRNDEANQIMKMIIDLLDSHDLSDSTDENNSLISLRETIREKVY